MATTLMPGDIAIIGFNFDNPDEFAFVPLVDLEVGTEIKFTDNGWLAAGGFRANEGTFTWTAPANVAAGTVINPVVSSVAFSASGDQILAYQGDDANPTFIYALNSEGNPGQWQSDATSSNTSALPAGLIDGTTAVALDEIDNAIYVGSTSGTQAGLLAAISDPSNWSGSNSERQQLPIDSFTVNSGGNSGPILNETFDYAENGEAASFSVTDSNGAASFFAEATSFDYFGVLDGDGDGGADFGADAAPSSFNNYSGFDDNHLIASDIDGGSPAIAEPAILTWSGLDIAGLSNLLFSVDVATDDTPASGGLDPTDFLKFEYSIDGGAFQSLLAFETADDSTFNQPTFLEDTDFDGIGDGMALTSTAETFNKTFAVAGTTLDLRASILVESGFEDIGFDNVTLQAAAGTLIAIEATNANQAEGDAGTTPFTFTITRSGDTSSAGSVDFAVAGNVDAADFDGTLPSGTVNFAADETTQIVTVDVSGDVDPETNEDFTLTLSNATGGATITTDTATGTIQNDDAQPLTLISTIQGNASTQVTTSFGRDDGSPLEGQSVSVQGVVTAVFDDLNAFFVQEEISDSDGDSTTSEGIFVFTGSDPTVSEGNLVTITGAVDEFFGMTQIDNDNGDFSVTIDDAGDNLNLVAPAVIDLPATGDLDDFYEQYEGMLVQFSDKLFVSEYFQLARFGQVVLTEGDRPFQYTHVDDTPTVAEFQAYEADVARRQIILDDGNNFQNAPLPDGTIF
ncbi:MAG: hypothetical protein AAGG53_08960, partial [Cyanobacteria bacterium P01_H01_bin.152]